MTNQDHTQRAAVDALRQLADSIESGELECKTVKREIAPDYPPNAGVHRLTIELFRTAPLRG